MARKKSGTVQISIKVPNGVKVPRAVLAEATKSAQAIVTSNVRFAAISNELAAQGIDISADELAKRAGSVKKRKVAAAAKPAGRRKRKRVVLSDAQRKQAVAELKKGATIRAVATKFGCSPQTVMMLKKNAGLVKAKKASTKK